ncbi:Oidioi.mRNA.OKI2018_I69.chr1.g2801.t1.cds [Oikopleura dioica]|uniref:Oidioi.mRNA.OKI2018_I69.chr1.g2801.t1.cds n=1 Tax=Oikopleura dioica TaxID=34765 RepID=A0ABN7SWI8_OIKDI|nr:Oidioi.mRNA.OKI2018_I69.chr1.g2801.t1.cds [Oikopleura dioica]
MKFFKVFCSVAGALGLVFPNFQNISNAIGSINIDNLVDALDSDPIDTALDDVGLINIGNVINATANDTLDLVNEIDFEGLVNDVVNLTEKAIEESGEKAGEEIGAETVGNDGAKAAIPSAACTAVLLLLY